MFSKYLQLSGYDKTFKNVVELVELRHFKYVGWQISFFKKKQPPSSAMIYNFMMSGLQLPEFPSCQN